MKLALAGVGREQVPRLPSHSLRLRSEWQDLRGEISMTKQWELHWTDGCLMLQTRALAERSYPMSFATGGGGARGPQINVTPLIDVLLTLIIMFMLVVSMDKQYQEKTQIPQPPKDQKSEPPPERTVVIEVVWTGKDQVPSVKINRAEVRWEDLETRLTQIYLIRVEKVAFVRGDADVDFQYVADVIDRAHSAGVQRVGLLTQDRMVEGE
jgi:biopolymer transport protein TolR